VLYVVVRQFVEMVFAVQVKVALRIALVVQLRRRLLLHTAGMDIATQLQVNIVEIVLEIVALVAQQLVVGQVVALAEVDIVVGGMYVLGEGVDHMYVTGFVVRVHVLRLHRHRHARMWDLEALPVVIVGLPALVVV
jgi:hypothetical protein